MHVAKQDAISYSGLRAFAFGMNHVYSDEALLLFLKGNLFSSK